MAVTAVAFPFVGWLQPFPYSPLLAALTLAAGLWLWLLSSVPTSVFSRGRVSTFASKHGPPALVVVATACAQLSLPALPELADVEVAATLRGCDPRDAKVSVFVAADVTRVRYYADDAGEFQAYASARIRDVEPAPGCAHLGRVLRGQLVKIRGLDMPPTTTVELAADVQPIEIPRNPFALTGPFEPPAARLTPREGSVRTVSAASHLQRLVHGARHRVRQGFSALPQEQSALLRALTLGEAYALSDDARSTLTDAGLAHVLAVSGLHVGLACLSLLWMVRRMLEWTLGSRAFAQRLDMPRLAASIVAPAVLLYATFAGGSPSALRAASMLALGLTMRALGRPPHGLGVVAATVVVLAALFPENLRSASWALSIAATWAIVSSPRTGSALRDLTQITLRTTIATTPLSLLWFGELQPIGLVTNLLLLPLYSVVVIPVAQLVSLEALLLGATHSPVSDVFAWVESATQVCARGLSALPFAHLHLRPGVGQLFLITVAAALYLLLRPTTPMRFRVGLAAALTVALAACEWSPVENAPRVRVVFFDVGQGDAALVSLPDDQHVLIDAGGKIGPSPDPGARVLVPQLRALRVRALRTAIISHAHPDHYGGLAAVSEALPIARVWHNRQAEDERETGEYTRAMNRLRAEGTQIETPEALCRRHPWLPTAPANSGADRNARPYRFEVVAPCPGYSPGMGLNDNSLVVRLVVGKVSFLFTGDIEHDREAAITASDATKLRATVVKVPHHGSRTSSTPALVEAVQPRWAVISSGRANLFGHPNPKVVDRWGQAGAEVLRTDQLGAVTFTTDGERIELRTTLPRRLHAATPEPDSPSSPLRRR